ncbi:MAG: monooxygenase, partial [Pseudonocardia sp.]|nr:monooxygenase [Pseudonocardia sp.]
LPGAFEEFVRMVVPILRARGVFRSEYTGNTLRDHLGLARPGNPARVQPAPAEQGQAQPALAQTASA